MAGRWVIESGRHADTFVAPAQGVEDAAWHRQVPQDGGRVASPEEHWGGDVCLIRSMFIAYGPRYKICPFGEHGAWLKGDCSNGGAE